MNDVITVRCFILSMSIATAVMDRLMILCFTSFKVVLCPPPKGRVRHQLDSFIYLMNRLADLNQICVGITLGHDTELIGFRWLWANIQGHYETNCQI